MTLKPQTMFRLAMLRNGYTPVLNECKRSILTGWQAQRIDKAEVLSWDHSVYASTGMRIENSLAAIDLDPNHQAINDALAEGFAAEFPEFFRGALVRHSVGAKEAWFARTEKPFRRLSSRLWIPAGADADDPATPKFQVETFGGASSRQFGVDGPHARDARRKVSTTYTFEDDASPATVPLADLPMLPVEAFTRVCDLFDAIAEATGLAKVKRPPGVSGRGSYAFVLEPETKIELEDGTVASVAELTRAFRRGSRRNASYLRCSGSFHDPTRVRRDSHAITWGRHGLTIHDFMTETNFVEASRREIAQSSLFEFLGQLRERGPFT